LPFICSLSEFLRAESERQTSELKKHTKLLKRMSSVQKVPVTMDDKRYLVSFFYCAITWANSFTCYHVSSERTRTQGRSRRCLFVQLICGVSFRLLAFQISTT